MTPDANRAGLPPLFPFTAIAGQPALTEALLLAAADPGLGGVLVEGPRGTAKSTAARALAELLGAAPFVTLPLSASLEQLAGTLDLGAALGGHALQFAPGLMARAHGGVLYVDEVNLLPDGLVDVLLDAAASGVNVVERDGISHAHAARFVLVGTMNPEEGELRPQLLDRFGLAVRLSNIVEPAQRQAVVRARLAFDADPAAFRARHADAQADLQRRLADARLRLADAVALPVGDAVHALVGTLCIAAKVDGLRADLVMLRAARALAALEAAADVTATHVHRVAELVLAHRRGPAAQASQASANDRQQQATGNAAGSQGETTQPAGEGASDAGDWGALPPMPVGMDRVKPLRPLLSALPARAAPKKALSPPSLAAAGARSGGGGPDVRRTGRQGASGSARPVDWPRTLVSRGNADLNEAHLRFRPKDPTQPALHCFLLDCSASMRSSGALAQAKGLLLSVMDEAYRRRDHVALLCFAGGTVELRLAPRRAPAWNEGWIAPIGGGGGTPLVLGVAAADRLLQRSRARQRSLWLLTDGRSRELPAAPSSVDELSVVDFESASLPLARAQQLALAWGAAYWRYRDMAVAADGPASARVG